jgi:uncharacterized protein (DUF433 family)
MEGISIDTKAMGGRPCISGTRVTVGAVVGLLAASDSIETVLTLYPYLTAGDVRNALGYAAWRSQEREIELKLA